MTWNYEKALLFIKEYEKRPALWKKGDKDYHNARKKEGAWREISKILQEDTDILKKKMENLRGTRRREKHRLLKRARTGKAFQQKNLFESTWFAWESMKFLDELDEPHITLPNYLEPKEEPIDEEYLENPEQTGYIENDSRSEDAEVNSEMSNAGELSEQEEKVNHLEKIWCREKRTSKRRITQDTRVEKVYSLKSRPTRPKKDDCAIFAEFIAEKLRKFDSRQRAILQHEIHDLVFRAEIATQSP